jgi:hypothetical protein
MNDHGLAPLEIERVVDSLKRGEAPACSRASPLGTCATPAAETGDVFRVEA